VVTIVKTKPENANTLHGIFAGEIFHVEPVALQIAEGIGFFFIAIIKHEGVPVPDEDVVDLLKGGVITVRLCLVFPGRFFAPAVIEGGAANIIAKLAVFPSGAERLAAFEA
jgi:hypothetical protein